MKLLWISNHPARPSGYGSQTRQVGSRLIRAGYDIEFAANDGSADGEWMGAKVRGSTSDRYSRDIARLDVERSGADWTIILYDSWVYTEGMRDPFAGLPRVAGWVPVDHTPIPPSILPWVSNHTAIAMAEYGRDQLERASERFLQTRELDHPLDVRYAPHAIDDAFVRREDVPGLEGRFRSVLNIPDDAYLVGIVAANTGTGIYDRKGFGDMATALGLIQRERPDVHVYVHSLITAPGSIDLGFLFAAAGCDMSRVIFADEYAYKRQLYTDDDMAGIYSSFDVLLSTSRGEGCGLAPWEAMACGVPVIVSNWTAQAEVVGPAFDMRRRGSERFPAGWRVTVDPDWDGRQGAYFGKPLVGEIAAALEEMIERKDDPALREAAIAQAATRRADLIFDTHWRPILEGMERALVPVEPVPINRAARRQMQRKAKATA